MLKGGIEELIGRLRAARDEEKSDKGNKRAETGKESAGETREGS